METKIINVNIPVTVEGEYCGIECIWLDNTELTWPDDFCNLFRISLDGIDGKEFLFKRCEQCLSYTK